MCVIPQLKNSYPNIIEYIFNKLRQEVGLVNNEIQGGVVDVVYAYGKPEVAPLLNVVVTSDGRTRPAWSTEEWSRGCFLSPP